ncbi:MAG: hypothetical protein JW769_04590 [Parachlamydiales bacterium]|nr:hypothetical protein [Parachlamydiales bacterium]
MYKDRCMIKKFSFLISLVVSFCIEALPVGNPATPKLVDKGFFMSPGCWIQGRVGYEGNYLSDARLENKTTSHKIYNVERFDNTALLSLSIERRFDLFALLGASRFNAKWQAQFPEGLTYFETGTQQGFLWEAGGKGIFYEWGNLSLSLGGRYAATIADCDWLTQNGQPQEVSPKEKWRDRTWQVDLAFSYKVDLFIPYLGMTYLSSQSRLKGDMPIADEGDVVLHMKTKNRYGMVVGCALSTGKICSINLEARLFNEEGVSVSGFIQF